MTQNKKLLVIFGITTLITLVITSIEINLILSSTNDLQNYATTGVVSKELKKISILGFFDGAIIVAWIITFSIILLKMIFPNHKTVKDAFFFDELSFLKDMPNQLKRGLDRK